MTTATTTAATWTVVPGAEDVVEAYSCYAHHQVTDVFAATRYIRPLPSGRHAVVDRYVYAAKPGKDDLDAAYDAYEADTGEQLPPAADRPDTIWRTITAVDVWANWDGQIGPDDEDDESKTIEWEARVYHDMFDVTLNGEYPFTNDGARRLAEQVPPMTDEEYLAVTRYVEVPENCRLAA